MNSNQGSVSLQEVIEAFVTLGGKGRSYQIEDHIIQARGGILPNKYQIGGWDSYRKTINQMIQFYTPGYKKYRGPQYFEKLSPGYFTMKGFEPKNNSEVVESRIYESSQYAISSKMSDEDLQLELENNRQSGIAGEEKVCDKEREWLNKNNRQDLAALVRRVSIESVGAGYDVLSYDLEGNPKYIEVKSSRGKNSKFYLTENELVTARRLQDSYWIYRVSDCLGDDYSVARFQNPSLLIDSGEWDIKPLSYTVQYI